MWSKLRGVTLAWTLLIGIFLAPFTVVRDRWLAALMGAGLLVAFVGIGLLVIWIRDRRVGR